MGYTYIKKLFAHYLSLKFKCKWTSCTFHLLSLATLSRVLMHHVNMKHVGQSSAQLLLSAFRENAVQLSLCWEAPSQCCRRVSCPLFAGATLKPSEGTKYSFLTVFTAQFPLTRPHSIMSNVLKFITQEQAVTVSDFILLLLLLLSRFSRVWLCETP